MLVSTDCGYKFVWSCDLDFLSDCGIQDFMTGEINETGNYHIYSEYLNSWDVLLQRRKMRTLLPCCILSCLFTSGTLLINLHMISCRSLFVLSLLVIVLSVLLRFTDSDYPFRILKHFLYILLNFVRVCIRSLMLWLVNGDRLFNWNLSLFN